MASVQCQVCGETIEHVHLLEITQAIQIHNVRKDHSFSVSDPDDDTTEV